MTYKTNILDFVNNLPTSNVKFAYKQSNQLYVRTSFKKMECCKTAFFIGPGNSQSYFHLFRESHIQYLLQSYQVSTNPVILYNVRIERRHHQDPNHVNHGDHITFGFHYINSNQDVKVQTHKTEYDADDPTRPTDFYARRQTCDFVLDSSATRRFSFFTSSKHTCLNDPNKTIKSTYREEEQHAIHKMAVQMLDPSRKKPVRIGGNGGSGGMPIQPDGLVSYKGISFASDVIYEIIDRFILQNDVLLSPRLFFDDESEHIVLFVDNDDIMRHIVLIHAKRLFKAAYALANPNLATKSEKQCLEKMIRACERTRSAFFD